MIELILHVCLLAEPDRCEDVKLSFMAQAVTPHQCMLNGQTEIAKWSAGHPKWGVRKWTCGVRREVAKA